MADNHPDKNTQMDEENPSDDSVNAVIGDFDIEWEENPMNYLQRPPPSRQRIFSQQIECNPSRISRQFGSQKFEIQSVEESSEISLDLIEKTVQIPELVQGQPYQRSESGVLTNLMSELVRELLERGQTQNQNRLAEGCQQKNETRRDEQHKNEQKQENSSPPEAQKRWPYYPENQFMTGNYKARFQQRLLKSILEDEKKNPIRLRLDPLSNCTLPLHQYEPIEDLGPIRRPTGNDMIRQTEKKLKEMNQYKMNQYRLRVINSTKKLEDYADNSDNEVCWNQLDPNELIWVNQGGLYDEDDEDDEEDCQDDSEISSEEELDDSDDQSESNHPMKDQGGTISVIDIQIQNWEEPPIQEQMQNEDDLFEEYLEQKEEFKKYLMLKKNSQASSRLQKERVGVKTKPIKKERKIKPHYQKGSNFYALLESDVSEVEEHNQYQISIPDRTEKPRRRIRRSKKAKNRQKDRQAQTYNNTLHNSLFPSRADRRNISQVNYDYKRIMQMRLKQKREAQQTDSSTLPEGPNDKMTVTWKEEVIVKRYQHADGPQKLRDTAEQNEALKYDKGATNLPKHEDQDGND